MFIERLVVANYRSLKDFNVGFGPGLNLIIGQNDAGKTNILRALAQLFDKPSETAFNFAVGAEHLEDNFYEDAQGNRASGYRIAAKLEGAARPKSVPSDFSVDLFAVDSASFGEVDADVCGCSQDNAGSLPIRSLSRSATCVWIVKRVQREPYKATMCMDVQVIDGSCYHLHDINVGMRPSIIQYFVHPCDVPNHRDETFLLRLLNVLLTTRYVMDLPKGDVSPEVRESTAKKACSGLRELLTAASLPLSLPDHSLAISIGDFDFSQPNLSFEDKHLSLKLGSLPARSRGDGVISGAVFESLGLWRPAYSLVFFDEPENYLHPHQQRLLLDSLERQTSDHQFELRWGTDRQLGQVIVATHSPALLRLAAPENINRIYKSTTDNASSIASLRQDSSNQNIDTERWKQLLWTRNVEMLFASHVFIVEGGEEYLFPAIADVFFQSTNWFDRNNISVVRAGGKGAFRQYASLLTAFKIPFSIVTDLDFLEDPDPTFVALLEQPLKDARAQMMQTFHTLRPAAPTGAAVKTNISNRVADWINFRNTLDNSINLLQQGQPIPVPTLTTLVTQWQAVKNRVDAGSHLQDYLANQAIRKPCTDLVNAFQPHGIYILAQGDLETYLNVAKMKTSDLSKDRVPLAISRAIARSKDWAEAKQYLNHSEELESILKLVQSRL